jgi:hypothetical protein
MHVSGRCLCGAVSYAGEAEPEFQVKCYCTDCRKTSAAGHAAMMGFAVDAIQVTGEVTEYHSRADSGGDVMRAFCPRCGAGIFSRNGGMPKTIFLRASTLDDPNLFAAQLVVYASRAPEWDPVAAGVPTFAEGPQGA